MMMLRPDLIAAAVANTLIKLRRALILVTVIVIAGAALALGLY